MVNVSRATRKDIQSLSRKIQKLLSDKNSQVYQDNVAKFGIPEEYVIEAFSERALMEASVSGKATFYVAQENRHRILGFAQIVAKGGDTAELDRIIVFPGHERQGIGAQLLCKALEEQKRKGMRSIIARTGKDETHARNFYEKNGFRQTDEATIDTPWGKKLNLVTYELTIERK